MNDSPLSLFRESCGAAGDIDLEVTDVAGGEVYRKSFPLPFLVVGRHEHADLVLADPEVNQRHAYLQMIGGRLWCLDLNSRTGLAWEDGGRRSDWLAPSRSVGIGYSWIRNLTAGAGEGGEVRRDPREALPDDHEALPAVALEFVNAAPGPTLWPVNRVLTLVGRSPACKVQLECPSVCKFHCGLLRTARGLWVADLLGGVVVNGERVRFARLADRDQLWVGQYAIRVHFDALPRTGFTAARPDGVRPPPARPAASALSAAAGRHRPPGGPAGGAAAPLPAGLDLAEPALLPLVSQFAQMQQHMLDQFQQTTLAMVQMFGKLHRDQTELVRQELDHLHKLTAELNALRNELPAPPAVTPRPPAGAADRTADGRPVSAGVPAAPTNGRPAALPAPSPLPQPADVHTWLQSRFDALRRERQSHWQKLLAFLRKKPHESRPPGEALA